MQIQRTNQTQYIKKREGKKLEENMVEVVLEELEEWKVDMMNTHYICMKF